MRKLILLGITVFSFFTLTAQDVTYKVLAVKGENAVEKSSTPNKFTPLMTGMKLQNKDKIILGDNAYLGLASSSGKTIELKAKGIYNVADLSGQLVADNSGLAQKYMEYIFSDLKSNEASAHNMSITGSVERSVANVKVDVLSAPTSKILLKPTQINWKAKEGVEEVHLSLSNFFEDEIYGADTKESSHIIDFASLNLNPDEVYKLTVVKKGDSLENGETIILKIPASAEQTNVAGMASSSESALQNMVSGAFLESNGFYLNSTEMFMKAAEVEPDVKDFTSSYEEYLSRIGSGKAE
jgi:succinate dehydrogenase flavin-adding protein (antitoxin of CptAB toxin-antitoxin module)